MLFVMGGSGRMGGAVLRYGHGTMRTGTRSGHPVAGADETVQFDMDDPALVAAALRGCTSLFVMRPPQITARAPFDTLMAQAKEAGITHIICASVYGAKGSRVLPHRHMEAAIKESGIVHTVLRPADFMQNLLDVHVDAIRDHGLIAVPAGRGRSAFLDVDDIGRAVASILENPFAHAMKEYDLTGPAALTFGDVAATLTKVLGHEIRYRDVSIPRFIVNQLRNGRPLSMSLVMVALYSAQRFGKAARVSLDFERITEHPARTLTQFLERERGAFT